MNDHLSDPKIILFQARALPSAEMMAALEHLAQCIRCRQRSHEHFQATNVDDLCEVIKLSQTEPRKTISDTLRELVHEALVNRRLQAFKRDQQEVHRTEQQATGNELKEVKATLAKLASQQLPLQPLLTEILGFTIAAEMKSHLLLQNFLLSRGVSEEAAHKLVAEQETRSRQNVETILLTILPSQPQKEAK